MTIDERKSYFVSGCDNLAKGLYKMEMANNGNIYDISASVLKLVLHTASHIVETEMREHVREDAE